MGAVKKIKGEDSEPKFAYEWNQRILVVDDEVEILDSITEILSPSAQVIPMRRSSRGASATYESEAPYRFEVVRAKNSEEAMAALDPERPFAMGFFDVRLGESMDGYDLAKNILQQQPKMFTVFVTAYNDRSMDSIQNFLGRRHSGHWDYLNKPFSQGEILQKARNFVSLYNLEQERQFRQQEMEALHRQLLEGERMSSVAAVARGVGHEFGNLLMQIMGTADVNIGKDAEAMHAALERILKAAIHAGQILDRFKDLSTPLETSSELYLARVDEILKEALDLLSFRLREQGVEARMVQVDPVEVRVNPTSLIQVFVNLTINALYVMPEGGAIEYRVEKQAEGVELKIRDHGPGIPEEDLEKVTEAFYTTKGQAGTGLGLAICREIIEMEHKGSFSLRNADPGLEVTVRIPFDIPKEKVGTE